MTHIERLGGKVEPLDGPVPRLTYQWDTETEILSGVAADVRGERGLTGSIELEDPKGAVVTLDFAGGIMRGIEVVVWPSTQTSPTLGPPTPDEVGQYVIVHAGFAISRLDESEAARVFETLGELGDLSVLDRSTASSSTEVSGGDDGDRS